MDINKVGVDKGSALLKLAHKLNITKGEVLYFGDRFENDGNDYPVKSIGIKSIEVEDEKDCYRKCRLLLQDFSV